MKKLYKNSMIMVLFMAMITINSCELQELNENPNAVKEVPVNVLLPFNQEGLARLMGGTTQVMAGIFMQYYEGIENHPLPLQTYRVDEALYTEWNFQDYYNGPMINIKHMIDIAEEDGYTPHYIGIGKTLMAVSLGNLTSLWGDVPYSEALKGSDNLSPVYDSQQDIYEEIQQLLDDALLHFEMDNPGIKPSTDDLLFGGDMEKWKQVVWALKARYYMHLTKKAADLGYDPAQMALDAIDNAMTGNDGDLVYQFGFSAAEQNPFYSFTRLGYLEPNDYFTQKMLLAGDPRRDYLYAKKFGVATLADRYYSSEDSPVHLMTYYEQKFIEAEARLRLNVNDPEIQAALNEAVRANMVKVSTGEIHDTIALEYANSKATLTGDFDADLSTIINQKYIAMFGSIESWTDFRRTGYPELTPNEGGDHNQNPGGGIPRRLPYCQTERLYNENIPTPLPNLQDRFWWDKE